MRIRSLLLLCVSILWMGVIFHFSDQPAKKSSKTSMEVGRAVSSALVPGFKKWKKSKQNVFLRRIHRKIRKAAHANEYMILGLLYCLTAVSFLEGSPGAGVSGPDGSGPGSPGAGVSEPDGSGPDSPGAGVSGPDGSGPDSPGAGVSGPDGSGPDSPGAGVSGPDDSESGSPGAGVSGSDGSETGSPGPGRERILLLWKSGRIAFFCGVFYACTDEFHQHFVKGRSAQLSDVLLDSGGVLLGVLLAAGCLYLLWTLQKFRTRRGALREEGK